MSSRLGRLGCGGFCAEREVKGMLRECVTADQRPEKRPSSAGPRSTCALPYISTRRGWAHDDSGVSGLERLAENEL